MLSSKDWELGKFTVLINVVREFGENGFLEVVIGVYWVWLGAAFCMPLHFASNINLPLFYFGLTVYSLYSIVVDWRNVQYFCSIRWDLLFKTYMGGFIFDFPSVLHVKFFRLWHRKTNLQCSNMKKCFSSSQFMDAVERYCMPAAVISLSYILISFLTVLISDCSALLCPLYPSASSFERDKHALNVHQLKKRGGLFGSRVNERRWHFKRTTLMSLSQSEVLGRWERRASLMLSFEPVCCGWCLQPVLEQVNKTWQKSQWTQSGP